METNHLFLFPSLKSIWVTTYMFTICFAANVGLLYGVVCTIVIVIFRFPRWDVIYWNVLVAHNYVFFLEHCFTVGIYLHYTKFNSEISVFSCKEHQDGQSWKGGLEAIWSNSCPGHLVVHISFTHELKVAQNHQDSQQYIFLSFRTLTREEHVWQDLITELLCQLLDTALHRSCKHIFAFLKHINGR